jgi:dipeptidyl aminopeptidase/acylaminoacyl peptidase
MNLKTLLPGMLWLPAATAFAAQVPAEHFAKLPEFMDVAISPDGEHVAVSVPKGNQTNLAVINLKSGKVTAAIDSGRDTHVAQIYWPSSTRVVVSMADSEGPLDQPGYTGEFNAVNVDGTAMTYLFGWRPRRSMSEREQEATVGFGSFVSELKNDPDHMLIASVHPRDVWTGKARATLYKVNVHTTAARVVARAPMEGFGQFIVDGDGNPRFAVIEDGKRLSTRTFRYRPETSDWAEIGSGQLGAEVEPLRISGDGKTVYVRARNDAGRYCLATLDPASAKTKPLYCHDEVDIGHVVFSADGNTPLAVYHHAGKMQAVWLNPEHPEAVALRRFAGAFPDLAAVPRSRTADGSKLIFDTFSDRNPGDFYLYDAKAGKAEYLFSSRGWIDPAQMAERRPVRYTARDGAVIHGYLTLPPGAAAKNLPLIVNPHGGPFGVRDGWRWDADPQAFASHGYAVLQVNFRGSGGYGHEHHEAGRGKWGTMMIDDITDGVRWTVEQGIADESRVCIYGGSYGGYAAMMSAVREPERYKCAVGYVGVYELHSFMRSTDIEGSKAGRNYMRQYIGDDPEELDRQSSINYLDRLKAAVFIVHGKLDERVPYNQATKLRKALDARDYPYEWLVKNDEGHGFYRVDARVELYERLFAFFDKHIGASR